MLGFIVEAFNFGIRRLSFLSPKVAYKVNVLYGMIPKKTALIDKKYLFSSPQTKFIGEQFFEFIIHIFSL